jgi:adenylosuccinate synthase
MEELRKKKAFIVVGAGFGDEGKGLVTDYYALKHILDKTLVIRFTGGHQAGHTVVLPDGKRHVFSSFGSGTLRGTPTLWTQYCTFCPEFAYREYEVLQDIGVSPQLFVDFRCPVTTPYDVFYNRYLEGKRGDGKHGSCGVGFGSTVERHESPYKLYVMDIVNEKILDTKLAGIRNYYRMKIGNDTEALEQLDEIDFEEFYDACDTPFFHTCFEERVIKDYDTLIFEGSQGIWLDKDFGFFPHVTRSSTTSKQAFSLLQKAELLGKIPIIKAYVTRAYLTRHGRGPLPGEEEGVYLKNTKDETNVPNPWQEALRTAPFNEDMLLSAITFDVAETSQYEVDRQVLFVTCTDQVDNFSPSCVNYFDDEDIFLSSSPISDNIICLGGVEAENPFKKQEEEPYLKF